MPTSLKQLKLVSLPVMVRAVTKKIKLIAAVHSGLWHPGVVAKMASNQQYEEGDRYSSHKQINQQLQIEIMTDTSAVFKQVAEILDEVAQKLKVEAVLITSNTPTHLRIEGTSGPAEKIYTVGAQQRKGSVFEEQHELYCEHLLNKNLPYLFVRDSRIDPVWDGNEDQVVFGLINYFGYPIRDGRGNLFGTICVLHSEPRDYSDEDKAALQRLQQAAENALQSKSSRVRTLAPVAESKIFQPLQVPSTSLKTEALVQPTKVAARA